MLDSFARAYVQPLFIEPPANYLIRLGVTHNQATAMALFLGMMIAPALCLDYPNLAVVLLCLTGYLDTIDGTMARITKQDGPLGSIFDIISDRIVESAVIFGIYSVAPAERATLSILMLASVLICITTFLVAGVFTQNQSYKSFHYSPGIMERTEAFIFFAAIILFPAYFFWLAGAFTVLVLATAAIRAWDLARVFTPAGC